jgi:hypothetical protein
MKARSVGDENNYLKLGSAEGQVMATPGADSKGEVGLGRKGNASLVDARLGTKSLYVRDQLGGLESNVKAQYPPAVTSRAYYASGAIGGSTNVLGFNPYLKVTGSVGHDLQEPYTVS